MAEEKQQEKVTTKLPNSEMSVQLIEVARNNMGDYDRGKLLEIINQVPWGKISFPIYSYKNLIFQDKETKGHVIVGYINGYDSDTETFELVIFGRNVGTILEFNDPIIYPRVITNKETGELTITAFDLAPKGIFSKILKGNRPNNQKFNKNKQ